MSCSMSFRPLRVEDQLSRAYSRTQMKETERPLPRHGVSIELQELQQVLGLLPVSGLLLSRQGVIRHEQGMSASPFQKHNTLRISRSPSPKATRWRGLTFGLQLQLLLPAPGVVIIFCQLLCHGLNGEETSINLSDPQQLWRNTAGASVPAALGTRPSRWCLLAEGCSRDWGHRWPKDRKQRFNKKCWESRPKSRGISRSWS